MKPIRSAFLLAAVLIAGACASAPPNGGANRWWKGNLHTHSLWTDGTDFPEMIASWYKQHGYNFLAVTEHDMLQGGERWVDTTAKDAGWPPRNASARRALPGYRAQFGNWLEEKREGDRTLVRLRGLDEYRHLFEEPGRFLLVMGEEITDKGGAHMNAFNLGTAVLPRGGATSPERLRNNLAAVAELQRTSSRPIVVALNHPNYVWSWSKQAEEVALIPQARFFEVFNGHRLVYNEGDKDHPGTERVWDIMLTKRHEAGLPVIYGTATDDAHDYREYGDTVSRPGRGWVMVRAPALTPEALLGAMSRGDFYASTGVTLRDVRQDNDGIRIEIAPEPGVTYRTTFIGTRKGASVVGDTLAVVDGTHADYKFKGDERYVRAKIVSSRAHTDILGDKQLGGWQSAWVQPVMR